MPGPDQQHRADAPTRAKGPDRFGPGQRLDASVQSLAERAYGTALGHVTVHTGPDADHFVRQQQAIAVTVGHQIALAPDHYRPGTLRGDALLAHELAHVVQQGARADGTSPATAAPHAYERDADHAAATALAASPRHRQAISALGINARAAPRTRPRTGLGLRLQRCNGDTPTYAVTQSAVAPSTPAPTSAGARAESGIAAGGIILPEIFGGLHTVIDADGDQSAELDLRFRGTDFNQFREPDRVNVEGKRLGNTPQTTPSQPSTVSFDTRGANAMRGLSPRLLERTDGRTPTRFAVTGDYLNPSTTLDVAPPPFGGDIVDYKLTATTRAFGATEGRSEEQHLRFPRIPEDIYPVFVTAGAMQAGPIWYADLAIGRFGDSYRFTFEKQDPNATEARLGISPMSEIGALGADVVTVPAPRPLRVSVVAAYGPLIDFDLDGDGRPDVRVWERVTPQTPWSSSGMARLQPESERILVITVTSPDGTREYGASRRQVSEGRYTRSGQLMADFGAVSAAATPEGLATSREIGDLAADLSATRNALDQLRTDAVNAGLVSQEAVQSYATLREKVTAAVTAPGNGTVALNTAAADAAAAFDTIWTRETAAGEVEDDVEMQHGGGYVEISNPYTGYYSRSGTSARHVAPTASRLADALRRGYLPGALLLQTELAGHIDRWVATRLRQGGRSADAARATALAGLARELDPLADKPTKRVAAVFHSAPDYVQQGAVGTVPLHMYYWREGGKWHLKDATHPDQSASLAELTVPDAGETEPPEALFAKLNDADRYPRGFIRYQLPGPNGRVGTVETTAPWTLHQVLAWIGTALAVAALVVGALAVSGGTAATVVVPLLWGLSAAAGVGSAVAHMVHESEQGRLDAATIVLDSAQIIASVAGGAVGAFRGVQAFRVAAGARAGLALTAAESLALLPVTTATLRTVQIIQASADVVQVVMMGEKLVEQLQAIAASNLPPGAKLRAQLLAFGQFGLTAGLTYVSVRGTVREINSALAAGGRIIRIDTETVVEGMHPLASYVAELERRLATSGLARADNGEAVTALLTTEKVRIMRPEEMGSSLGLARVEVVGDRFRIAVVDGAHPSVIAAEVDHLEQLALTRRPAAGLSAEEARIRTQASTFLTAAHDWASRTPVQRVQAHRAQVELELDAQRRFLARVESAIDDARAPNASAADVERAFMDIENLRQRQAALVDVEARVGRGESLAAIDAQLDVAPVLFSKRTAPTNAVPANWRTLNQTQFVESYRAAFPNTTLTREELRQRWRMGRRLNPETLYLTDPNIDIPAHYSRRTAVETVAAPGPGGSKLSQAERSELDAMLQRRDLARQERDAARSRAVPDEEAAGRAQARMNEASRQIGDAAGVRWVQARYGGPPPPQLIHGGPGAGSTSGDFDQVWRCTEMVNGRPREVWIVIEAKGGAADLGSRATPSGRAQQGSLPYFEEIIRVMQARGGTARTAADGLRAARQGGGRIRYMLVEAGIEYGTTRTGAEVSRAGAVQVSEFDLSVPAPSGSASSAAH